MVLKWLTSCWGSLSARYLNLSWLLHHSVFPHDSHCLPSALFYVTESQPSLPAKSPTPVLRAPTLGSQLFITQKKTHSSLNQWDPSLMGRPLAGEEGQTFTNRKPVTGHGNDNSKILTALSSLWHRVNNWDYRVTPQCEGRSAQRVGSGYKAPVLGLGSKSTLCGHRIKSGALPILPAERQIRPSSNSLTTSCMYVMNLPLCVCVCYIWVLSTCVHAFICALAEVYMCVHMTLEAWG